MGKGKERSKDLTGMLSLLFSVILDEKAEVAMAVLPFVIQPRAGTCNHKDFLEFISVSVVIH